MSRPYLHINSVSYATASSIITLNYTAFKLRGGGSMSLTGFTASLTFNETLSNEFQNSLTFSVSPTQSSGTYTLTLNFPKLGGSGTYTYTF